MTQNAAKENVMEVPKTGGAEWLRGMQAYYGRTGSYRPEDVMRVLGDPRQAFEIEAMHAVAGFCRKK